MGAILLIKHTYMYKKNDIVKLIIIMEVTEIHILEEI